MTLSRRSFLASAALARPFHVLAGPAPTDSRLEEVRHEYEDFLYRTPIKFGGTVVDRVTLLNVHVTVSNPQGKRAQGFGSMPLGNVWSWPTRSLRYDETLAAMKALAEKLTPLTRGYREYGHPVDINVALEPEYLKMAAEVSRRWSEPIPKLCTLVVASPFDAAIHDAYGKLHGVNCFSTYGPEFLRHDLGHYLGAEFTGDRLDRYVTKRAKPAMPLYHLVGAVDPITAEDIKQRLNDGLPETVPEWIERDGLTNIKIKLNGDDLKWDVERVVRVDRIAAETQKKRGLAKWVYSLDFNERCPNIGYLMDFVRQVKEKTPEGFRRVQYIEQPTGRDLTKNRENVMHEAAKLLPVVIDESLTELESLHLAREMGYSGAALKACKGQTQALLMGAAIQKYKMFLCVQDLTCPGASLIHSASLAAHLPSVAAIEANSRQYVPAANKGWDEKFPGVFTIRGGVMNTRLLDGKGLGAV
ncbi:MAG: enolase C-terminal domain-like protein [Bryobacteraceae bacterium]|nr:enolase C-terminal domain-like protein [Bryobacteraceae bacterium]